MRILSSIIKADFGTVIIILLLVSSTLIFILNDNYEAPVYTNQTINDTVVTNISCPEDYTYQEDKDICFNPSPLGHETIPFFLLIFFAFVTGGITEIQYTCRRFLNTPKLLPFKNKHQEALMGMPIASDIIRSKGFTILFKGYQYFFNSIDKNEIYFSPNELIHFIGSSPLWLGEFKQITPHRLYAEIFKKTQDQSKALELFYQLIPFDSWGINPLSTPFPSFEKLPAIYMPVPLPNDELAEFYSLNGNYGFNADRFVPTLKNLNNLNITTEKRRDEFRYLSDKMAETVLAGAQARSNITQAVEEGNTCTHPQQPASQPDDDQERM